MITLNELIRDWNTMGTALKADFLGKVFKKLETAEDVAVHNFIMYYLEMRLGPEKDNFLRSIEELIEQYSLRNIEDGAENKSINSVRT